MRLRAAMARHGPLVLRIAVGLVFVWFGLLKVVEESPVADLVAQTLAWLPVEPDLRLIGAAEIVLGVALMLGRALRVVLAALWLHLLGTFLPFALLPHIVFRGNNPFLLTVEGEFIVKNLVLIAAGIIIAGDARNLPRARTDED